MAKEYNFEMYGQPSLYTNKERKFQIYFSEPEAGTNKETGILLFIAGFGGNANSNVYKKMRNEFADKHNLITIQCDYFGWEFMQTSQNIDLNLDREKLKGTLESEELEYIFQDDNYTSRLLEIAQNYELRLSGKEKLAETLDNFNDMGLVQAMDNISAVIGVMEILKDNGYEFDKNKVILYGNSHGSYLSYLCNAFAPKLFTFLLDNSAWLFPCYLKSNRYLNQMHGKTLLTTEFEYLARKLDKDEEILDLAQLYKHIDNRCTIVCYHGTDDNLISHREKAILKKRINNFYYNEIGPGQVDHKIFKSNQHGLNADYLELFEYVAQNYDFKSKQNKKVSNENLEYTTKKFKYKVDYSHIVPILSVEKNK